MPSYVTNRLIIEGADKEPDIFADGQLNFNKIIPMPETGIYLVYEEAMRNVKKGIRPTENTILAKKCLDALSMRSKSDPLKYKDSADRLPTDALRKEVYGLGLKTLRKREGYGAEKWYDWCCEYWGTKWNAMETEIDPDGTINFLTVWSPPYPILAALSKMCQDATVTCYYDGEIVEPGYVVYKNGEIIEQS